MPVPRWVTKVNRRVFNPMEIKRGERPVLTHTGRVSGRIFRTPLDAHAVEGGFIFILVYGAESDWVRNILTSGSASLSIGEEEYRLTAPRLISKEDAWGLLPEATKPPPGFLKVTEYLQMDVLSEI